MLEWLVARFPRVGEAAWRARMARQLVLRADGVPLSPTSPYEAHLEVRYFREVATEVAVPFAERIVFEDEHLVVADKPPFLPVTPGGRFVRECLLARLADRFGDAELAPLHRIDRATSGLVVLGRRAAERGAYCGLFASRRVTKMYEAIAVLDGRTAAAPGDRWRVERRLVRGTPFFRMRETPGTPNSCTDVELVGTWNDGEGTLGRFRLRPHTGKKHQLRLHMACLGFPILGDRLYPDLQPEAPDDPDHPLRLVAKELRFGDPITGEARRFVSAYDADTPTAPSSSTRTTSKVRSSA